MKYARLVFLLTVFVGNASCAEILKPCPECNTPNNPADYPPLNDDGDNPSQMAKPVELVPASAAPSTGFLRYQLTGWAKPRKSAKPTRQEAAQMDMFLGTSAVWVGPSVGLNVFTIDLKTRQSQLGLIPGVGYGVKWKPAGWTLTDDVLALDVFVQGSLLDQTSQVPGAKWFTVQLMPIVTIIDWVSVGFGFEDYIAVDSAPGGFHPIFSFGINKSL